METIVCPYCNGSGCDQCQHSGQIQATAQEIAQLQALMQTPVANQATAPYYTPQPQAKASITDKTLPGSRITLFEVKTKVIGLVSFGLIVALIGGAYLSNKYLGSFFPYAATVLSILALSLACFLTKKVFFQYHEPDDFLSFSKKFDLQKPPSIQ